MEENRGKRPTLGEVAALAGSVTKRRFQNVQKGASVSTLTRTR